MNCKLFEKCLQMDDMKDYPCKEEEKMLIFIVEKVLSEESA